MAIEIIIGAVLLAAVAGVVTSTLAYKKKNRRRRILVEDALKHLHDFEYSGLQSTLESLAGAMGVQSDVAATIDRKSVV